MASPRLLPLCLLMLAAAVTLAGAGEAKVPLLNPGFEQGLEGWGRKVDPLDPQAIAVDEKAAHGGSRSLRITQTNAAAYTNAVQMFRAERYTNYVFTGYVKAEGVVRRGIGINCFVGDARGHGVGDPIPDHLHEGTYDWTRVVVPFNSGPHETISIFCYLHEATGTAWFDDLEFRKQLAWQGPAGPPAGRPAPPELPEAQGYDYDTLGTEVTTAHWACGKPLRRRLRVAVLAPVWSQRETVELAQRLDCEPTAIMTHNASTLGTTGWSYKSLALDDAQRMVLRKLDATHDVLVIGRQKWASLPEDARTSIIEKVRAGMGLVYVEPAGEKVADALRLESPLPLPEAGFAGLPLASLPAFTGLGSDGDALRKTLSLYALDRGRVAVLSYGAPPSSHHYLTPPTTRALGGFRHYDLYQSLLAKAVVWASGETGGPRIRRIGAPGVVVRGRPAHLEVHLEGASKDAAVSLRVRRAAVPYRDFGPWVTKVALAGAPVRVALPPYLPGGDTYCDVTLDAGGTRCDWGTAVVRVKAPVDVAVTLAQAALPDRAAPLRVRVALSAPLPALHKLRVLARDAHGRCIARRDLQPRGRMASAELDCSLSRSLYNTVEAEVLDGGNPVAMASAEFTLRAPYDLRDFHSVAWGHGGSDYIGALVREELRRSGVDACDLSTGPWDARPLDASDREGVRNALWDVARAGMAPLPYICRIWPAGNKADDTIRTPCLSDPAYRAALDAAMRKRADICRSFGPIGYTLGDENYLGEGSEFCLSPTCLAHFTAYLRETYGSLDALNRSWGTELRSFDEARPLRRLQVKGAADYPRWVDWRLCMNRLFADTHRDAISAIAARDPGARIGFDGAYGDTPTIGYDWGRLGSEMGLWNVYISGSPSVQVEAMRSFHTGGALTGAWFGGYTYQRLLPAYQRWAPWYQLFHGCNSSWWYSPYTGVGGSGEIGFRPDLRAYDCWRLSAAEARKLKSGIGKLLLSSRRESHRIAVLYSPPSQMVTALDTRHGGHLAALQSVMALLEDSGFQYDLLPDSALSAPGKALGGYAALILPVAAALPDAALPVLERFAAGGRVLLADWGAGLYDAHGKARDAGLLDDLFGVRRESAACGHLEEGLPGLVPMAKVEQGLRAAGAMAERTSGGVPLLLTRRVGQGACCYLNLDLSGYRNLRGPAGRGLHEALRRLLALGKVDPPLCLRGQWGSPEKVEVTRWRLGSQECIGLLKAPDTLGDGEDLELPVAAGRYVYDVLRGKSLGRTTCVRLHLGPGEAALYALLPGQVRRVLVQPAKGGSRHAPLVRIRVEHNAVVKGARVLRLTVRRPDGRPYPAADANLLCPSAEMTHAIPLDLEAPPGDWRVIVTDVATGVSGTARITMAR